MAFQVYLCKVHGEFQLTLTFAELDKVPPAVPRRCPVKVTRHTYSGTEREEACGRKSKHILKPIATAIIEGGTGAGRGMYIDRKKRQWEAEANDQRRDPYTQAKAQMDHSYNEQKDMGADVAKPTEESIQAAAKEIAKEKKKPARRRRTTPRKKRSSK